MLTLDEAVRRADRWMAELAALGTDVRVTAHLKTVHEAKELAANPTDIEEVADVTICLAGVVAQSGWSIEDWALAIQEKVSVNAVRAWRQLGDGTWRHE